MPIEKKILRRHKPIFKAPKSQQYHKVENAELASISKIEITARQQNVL